MSKQTCHRLALFATLLAGAGARRLYPLDHAGLGCPDWPGCYGFIGVPMSEHKQTLAEVRFPEAPVEVARAGTEMIHRYLQERLVW
jgi:cytochrome c oxidase assembly protein subunit 15